MEKQLLPLGLAGRDEVVEELADVEEEREVGKAGPKVKKEY